MADEKSLEATETYGPEYFDPTKGGKPVSGYDRGYSEEGIGGKFDFIAKLVNQECIKSLVKKLGSVKVLELGGAKGFLTKRLNQPPKISAFNVDISEYATQKAVIKGGRTIQADVQAIPFANESFDVLVSCDTLEHIPEENINTVLNEAFRTLKSGGRVFFLVTLESSYQPKTDQTHVNMHDQKWWEERFHQANFDIRHDLLTEAFNKFQGLQPHLKNPRFPFREGLFILSKK